MFMLSSVKARQRVTNLFSVMILIAVLVLPLACASISKERSLTEVKGEVEATWILEEWYMKGEAVSPPKVEGHFIIHDNAFVLILLNRAGELPWSYYGYGKYTIDASTFSMKFDEVEFFKESTSGITVSRKLLWDGKMKSFAIRTENNQLHMRSDDIDFDLIVDGDTLTLKQGGKITRTYRRAGAK
ncbi:MAG: hypothetical protein JSV14_09585 [Deltaproteobacteria bacterium]|nr:MAG: hypothetical protein JSV14_09585 [Deltaproteobacteria bacterium]